VRYSIYPCFHRTSTFERFETVPKSYMNLLEQIGAFTRVGFIGIHHSFQAAAVCSCRLLIQIIRGHNDIVCKTGRRITDYLCPEPTSRRR
jgi:hypothetical protein